MKISNQYKNDFWQTKYHNENILNKNRRRYYWDDKEFCEYWGIKVQPVIPIKHHPFKQGKGEI